MWMLLNKAHFQHTKKISQRGLRFRIFQVKEAFIAWEFLCNTQSNSVRRTFFYKHSNAMNQNDIHTEEIKDKDQNHHQFPLNS